MLGHVQTQMSQLRREQIKLALSYEYKSICSSEVPATSQQLFGDKLSKHLKDARETSNLRKAIKPKNTASNRPNRNMPEKTPFLGGKPPFKNRGNQGKQQGQRATK